jgi:hypothetical protein
MVNGGCELVVVKRRRGDNINEVNSRVVKADLLPAMRHMVTPCVSFRFSKNSG